MQPVKGDQGVSGEPFELLSLLGRGGFAHTYKARVLDDALRELFGAEVVALKEPLNRKKELVLQREIEMGAALHLRLKGINSLNIVRYLGFAVFRGKIVMLMEYIAEGSLRDRLGEIGRQRRVPIEEAVKIAEGVLAGLEVIHHEHVFHRDIKPENILLEGDTPKIADLGIARMLDANELASTGIGSLPYMSPEILGKEGASFPSDLWSLGVTLYEMVTGKLPFGGLETPLGDMADMIRRTEPLAACKVCGDVPAGLSEIIARSLTKSLTDRFGSATEMREALRRFRQKIEDRIEQEMAVIRESMVGMEQMSGVEAKLQNLLARYPRDPRAYQYVGEFYNRCQRYGEALTALKKGIEISPGHALLHWDLALAYQRNGQRELAARALRKAMSIGLDDSLQRYAATLLKVLEGSGA